MRPRFVVPLLAGPVMAVLLLAPSWITPLVEPTEAPPPALAAEDWPMWDAATRGRHVYELWCLGCHGETGRGDGPAAVYLNPEPRNFQKGYFKFRSTPSGRPPSRDDLLRTVTCGLPGSAMPSFRLLPEPERKDVVEYVLWLSTFGKANNEVSYLIEADDLSMETIRSQHLPELRSRILQELEHAEPVSAPPPPEPTDELVARGRERYLRECSACHGAGGRGDGPSSYTLRDWKNAQIVPRDFTTGVFRAGSTPRDLFLRLKTGVNGTPMPSISGTDEDLWALVFFIRSLIQPSPFPSSRHECAPTEVVR